ncbi:MAG TPA: hypothetical protein PLJ88_11430 [Agitococcus sp.]|nr:hypothetical protein [Agitococcus sp.]
MSALAIYHNELHAIIRAMAVDSISSCKPSSWQGQYKSGFVEDLTKKHHDLERLTPSERFAQDCITRSRLHRASTRGGFYAMVAKHGADEKERAMAVNELVALIDCDGVNDNFKRLIIWTWASVKIKRGFMERIVDMCEQSRRTVFRKKREILKQLDDFEKSVITDCSTALSDVIAKQ